jgi:hypothetical protein
MPKCAIRLRSRSRRSLSTPISLRDEDGWRLAAVTAPKARTLGVIAPAHQRRAGRTAVHAAHQSLDGDWCAACIMVRPAARLAAAPSHAYTVWNEPGGWLRLPACGMTAVVAGFLEADRALMAWKQTRRSVRGCEYAIVFTDGVTLQGKFSAVKARSLPSLWRIIQFTLGITSSTAGVRVNHALVDRHGTPLSMATLERYALERS